MGGAPRSSWLLGGGIGPEHRRRPIRQRRQGLDVDMRLGSWRASICCRLRIAAAGAAVRSSEGGRSDATSPTLCVYVDVWLAELVSIDLDRFDRMGVGTSYGLGLGEFE